MTVVKEKTDSKNETAVAARTPANQGYTHPAINAPALHSLHANHATDPYR